MRKDNSQTQQSNSLASQFLADLHAFGASLFAFVQHMRLNNPRSSLSQENGRGFSFFSSYYYYPRYAVVPYKSQRQAIQRNRRRT